MTIPRISFIVPVRNDAARLAVCLRSIVDSAVASDAVELIVVDNGSRDGSPEVARRFGATVLTIANGRVSMLRNTAARQASGDILAFVDADNEIADGWLAAARENLAEPEVAATGALYVPPPSGTWVQRAYGVLRGQSHARQDTSWLGSGNLAVTRRAFGAVGGFDATLEACEDVDFCLRLKNGGWRLLADPRMRSIHHGDPTTLAALFAGELWRSRDNLRVSFRRPIAWRSVPSALIPVVDLVLLAGALAGGAGLLAGWRPGLLLTPACLLLVGLGSALRALMSRRKEASPAANLQQLWVVTFVYDLARALAVVFRAPHRRTRTRVAEAAS